MYRILSNTRQQRWIGAIYFALALAVHARPPDVGTILPYLELTTILTPYSIAAIYFWCSGFLLRSVNIVAWKYIAVVMPLLISCLYLVFYMAGTPTTSLVTGVWILSLATLIINDLYRQVVARG